MPDAGQEICTHGEHPRHADQYFSKRTGTLVELESRDQEMKFDADFNDVVLGWSCLFSRFSRLLSDRYKYRKMEASHEKPSHGISRSPLTTSSKSLFHIHGN